MSRRFVVVYEAPADFMLSTELADRVLVESIDWLDDQGLQYQREWIGETGGRALKWSAMRALAAATGIRIHGHFDGRPGLADASMARRAIWFIKDVIDDVDAIILIRDSDNDEERRGGLEQARQACRHINPIVIGLAHCERESWVVCGFGPLDANESEAIRMERQKLGFDPCLESHRLTACKDDAALKSPKRVLFAFTRGDRVREERCWRNTSLGTLEARGAGNGLKAYLDEVRAILMPLIAGTRGSRP